MRRSKSYYGGYRGRKTLTDILRYIAIVLAVLVALLLAALFWGQEYLVYTDDGLRLELPFLQREENPLPELEDISYAELPADASSGEPEPERTPAMAALQLPVDSVLDGSAAARLEAAGADALILEMKGADGVLRWYSEQALAQQAGANGDPSVNQVLEQWNQGEIYTIARVVCFQDDTIPYYNMSMSLRRGSSGNWRDAQGLRWLSAGSEQARDYVAALCGELAALGFDEIVLEQAAFPTAGDLASINQVNGYDPSALTAQAQAALEQIARAVAPYGTVLSLRVEGETLAGTETASGLTAQLLEDYAARLWVEDGGLPADAEQLLTQAGLTGGAERLVRIVPGLEETRAAAQALLAQGSEE